MKSSMLVRGRRTARRIGSSYDHAREELPVKRAIAVVTCTIAIFATTVAWAQSLQPAKPEDVGLSSDRLAKIDRVFKQDIDQGKIPGHIYIAKAKAQWIGIVQARDADEAVKIAAQELVARRASSLR